MDMHQILNNPALLEQLNNKIQRYTNFNDVEDLVNPIHNYRLTLYFEDDMNHLQKVELVEVADFYDAWMEEHNDPRRIYRIGA